MDYEDYLRVRNLRKWDINEEKAVITRKICSQQNESAFYREAITKRSDETICNIAITLIYQADYLLRKYLEKLQQEFLRDGGIKEQMYKARVNSRNNLR